jgi:putative chitinase
MAFTFNFTKAHLKEMIGDNPNIDNWFTALCEICPTYDIDSPTRLAAFIAQCAHESGKFRLLSENLNYKAASLIKTWPKHFPNMEIAERYANKPEMIANKAYANRMGNGDETSGDGWKYLGRGLIQLTGKENYSWFAASVSMDVEDVPKYLATFEGAVQSACFFWETNKLNQYADNGDILTMTKRINGGTIGLADRIEHYNHALSILTTD